MGAIVILLFGICTHMEKLVVASVCLQSAVRFCVWHTHGARCERRSPRKRRASPLAQHHHSAARLGSGSAQVYKEQKKKKNASLHSPNDTNRLPLSSHGFVAARHKKIRRQRQQQFDNYFYISLIIYKFFCRRPARTMKLYTYVQRAQRERQVNNS